MRIRPGGSEQAAEPVRHEGMYAMYHFAIVALLGIGVIKLVDFLVDFAPAVPQLPLVRSVLTFAAAIAAVWLLDAMGVWFTALMVSGATVPWRAGFRWLTHDSSTIDEPLGEHAVLRKVA
jgi:hypothetical protein